MLDINKKLKKKEKRKQERNRHKHKHRHNSGFALRKPKTDQNKKKKQLTDTIVEVVRLRRAQRGLGQIDARFSEAEILDNKTYNKK